MFFRNLRVVDSSFSPRFWTCCAVLCLSVAWFIPNHYPPLHDFYNDVWLALFVVGVWVWALATRKLDSTVTVPFAAVVLCSLALIPLLQWLVGLLPYSGQALFSSAYLLACALVLMLGFALQRHYRDASVAVLFAAILLAALANALIIFIQKTGLFPYDDISFPGVLVYQIYAPRSAGNLGQANQVATLLVWGLLSAWWFLRTQRLRLVWFLAASAILSMALVCTQSRTAYLNLLLVSLFATAVWRHARYKAVYETTTSEVASKLKPAMVVPVMWLLMIAAGYGVLYLLEHWLGLSTELRGEVTLDPVRTVIYPRFFQAALNHFWFGYGWSHLAKVQMDFPLDGIEVGVYFLHSHSIFLDLILWLGVPIGVCVIGLMLLGLFWLFKRIRTIEHFILVAIPLVLLGHAAVEFPHMYAYFLLPAAWVVGVLSAQLRSGEGWHTSVRRYFLNGLSAVLVFILVACIWDQQNISRELMLIRLKSAKIMTSETAHIDRAIVLNQFEDRLRFQYMPPAQGTSEQQLTWMRRAVIGYPVPITHYNLIGHLALNGHAAEAQTWMKRFNNVTTQPVAKEFAQRWEGMRQKYPQLSLAAWPVTGVLLFKAPTHTSKPPANVIPVSPAF